jgi:hypothetical protein
VLASNLRVLLAVCYIVLLVWRTVVEGHLPEYWWIVLIVYFVSVQLTRWGEAFSQWFWVRRVVQLYRLLEPATREATLRRMWMAGASQRIRELVEAEGEAEIEGVVERYPFARGTKLAAVFMFWSAIGIAAILYSLLVLRPKLPSALAWGAWALGSISILSAGVLRRRMKHLESTLELSRYGIAEVEADGTRRTLRWKGSLLLRYRRWPKRLELSSPGHAETIHLDFNRVAVDRAVRLTLEYGGFGDLKASEGDAA